MAVYASRKCGRGSELRKRDDMGVSEVSSFTSVELQSICILYTTRTPLRIWGSVTNNEVQSGILCAAHNS